MQGILLFSILCIGLPFIECAPKPKRDCVALKNEADKCLMSAVMMGVSPYAEDRVTIVPKDAAGVDGHCKRVRKDLNCMKRYAKCLDPFPKTIFQMVVINVQRAMKTICKTDAAKAELLKHMLCFTDENIKVLHHVVNEINVITEYMAANVSADQLIQWGCCTYFTVFTAGREKVDQLCLAKSGPQTADYIMQLVKTVAAEAVDLGCGEKYGTVAGCQYNLGDGMTIMKDLIYPPERVPDFKTSPVFPLIKIVEKLDSSISPEG